MRFVSNQFDYQDAVTLDNLVRQYARSRMTVFELGVYTGRASLVMLRHIKVMRGQLYAIDWFKGNLGVEAIINTTFERHDIQAIYQNNIREYGYEAHTNLIVATTESAAPIVADQSVDILFIDADHRYSQVRRDILNWYPKLKSGGLLAGHDFEKRLEECDWQRVLEKCEEDFTDGCHYGVIRAVSEFFPNVQHEGRIWYTERDSECSPTLKASLEKQKAASGLLEGSSTEDLAVDLSIAPVYYLQSLFPDEDITLPAFQTGKPGHDIDISISTLSDMKAEISDPSASTLQVRHLNTLANPDSPQLVLQNYHGYNLVAYQGQIFALAASLGPMDITQLTYAQLSALQNQGMCFLADSIETASALVDEATPYSPTLIETNYAGYNLVTYRGRFYAIAISLGHFDLAACSLQSLLEYEASHLILVGGDLAALHQNLNDLAPVAVEDDYEGYHLLWHHSTYYALADRGFVLDLARMNEADLRNFEAQRIVVRATSLPELKNEVATQLSANPTPASEPLDWVAGSTGGKPAGRERALLLATSPAAARKFTNEHLNYDVTVLPLYHDGPNSWLNGVGINLSQLMTTLARLDIRNYSLVILPYGDHLYWRGNNLISLIQPIASRIMLIFKDGRTRIYSGEDIHRLQYNAAYINSMFRFVPRPHRQRVLEVGCSDGLICSLMLEYEPRSIFGIDLLPDTGARHPAPQIAYSVMDAEATKFNRDAFDLTYCIAVMEHIKHPRLALKEILRVTQPGGHIYVQAGPLYFSPYGHHMFGFFDDYPWIHLRLSKAQIADQARKTGVDVRIKQATGLEVEQYLDAMLNIDHLNGLKIQQYELEEVMAQPDVEVLSYTKSYEGENLLTASISQELGSQSKDDLTLHGFELILRKR